MRGTDERMERMLSHGPITSDNVDSSSLLSCGHAVHFATGTFCSHWSPGEMELSLRHVQAPDPEGPKPQSMMVACWMPGFQLLLLITSTLLRTLPLQKTRVGACKFRSQMLICHASGSPAIQSIQAAGLLSPWAEP